MNQKNIYIALLKINNNTSLFELTHEGLSFQDISGLIKELITHNLLEESDNELKLSKLGIETLKNLEKNFKKRNKENWIQLADDKFHIKSIDKNFIFVPIQTELNF